MAPGRNSAVVAPTAASRARLKARRESDGQSRATLEHRSLYRPAARVSALDQVDQLDQIRLAQEIAVLIAEPEVIAALKSAKATFYLVLVIWITPTVVEACGVLAPASAQATIKAESVLLWMD